MVDVNTQNKTISVNVSSSGVSSNVNASGDTTMYYSNKAREWAISNRIVDGVDYSSKYYAGRANQSALNAQSFAQSAQDSYNNFQDSVDGALSTVNDTVQDAITTIDTKSGEAVEIINNSVDGVIEDIEAEANEQIANIERTGFYMRDDKLYFINSEGEEEEFAGGSGFNLFDTKISDHILEGKEAKGWALQGTYVSKAFYPDFYNSCLEQYTNENNTKQWEKSNVSLAGNLVDNKGLLSGFNSTSYATLDKTFNPSSNSWEIVIPYKTSTLTDISQQYVFASSNFSVNVAISESGQLDLYVSSNGTSWNVSNRVQSTLTVQTNTQYYIKAEFSGTNYIVSVSTNNVDFTEYINVASTAPIYPSEVLRLGVSRSGITATAGQEINLNEAYININNSRFWNGTVSTIQNANGHKFYPIVDKPIIDEIFNQYGIADFYGIDEENERVFLPRNKYFQQLTDDISKVNEMVEAGLPNIEGGLDSQSATKGLFNLISTNPITGAFTAEYESKQGFANNSTTANFATKFYFNASLSNPIYGNSNTVQPPSSLKLLYYCVGNTVVNDSNIDAGSLVAQIEQKANIFLDNVLPTQEFKSQVISWGMPSDKYIDLTLGASGAEYIAPANGWVAINKNTNSNSAQGVWISIRNPDNVWIGGFSDVAYTAGAGIAFMAPVKKGGKFIIGYTAGGATKDFKFIYAQGEE